jgi:hypothetical protein
MPPYTFLDSQGSLQGLPKLNLARPQVSPESGPVSVHGRRCGGKGGGRQLAGSRRRTTAQRTEIGDDGRNATARRGNTTTCRARLTARISPTQGGYEHT